MSLRKLAGLVGLLVLCTGFAVGLYVEALQENPVEAGYAQAGPGSAQGRRSPLEGPWAQRIDDVRLPSRRLRVGAERRAPGRPAPGDARRGAWNSRPRTCPAAPELTELPAACGGDEPAPATVARPEPTS